MANALDMVIRSLQNPEEARACARVMAGSEPWLTLGRTFEEALKLLRDPVKEVYVASAGDSVLGFIILHLGCPFSGYIQTIAVTPEWRHQGIGTKLLAFAEARILRESPNVFLCVSSFNTQAQRLYARLGYERVGEFEDYLVHGHSEILMRKTRGPLAEFRPKAGIRG